jgi:hypothetical protein
MNLAIRGIDAQIGHGDAPGFCKMTKLDAAIAANLQALGFG